jgi:hypothetical protein
VIRKANEGDDWRKKDDLEGVYKVDNVLYESLPSRNWYDIFTFSKKNPFTDIKWTKGGKKQHPVGYNGKFEDYVVKLLGLS